MLTVKEMSANIDFYYFIFSKANVHFFFFPGEIEDHSHHNWMRIPKVVMELMEFFLSKQF